MQQDLVALSEGSDDELLLALRELAQEEIEPPLGMISRLEAGLNRPERLSGQASTVVASVAFIVCGYAYTTLVGMDFAGVAALAAACGCYGLSLRWLLDPKPGV